jgi:hypothetical protein
MRSRAVAKSILKMPISRLNVWKVNKLVSVGMVALHTNLRICLF